MKIKIKSEAGLRAKIRKRNNIDLKDKTTNEQILLVTKDILENSLNNNINSKLINSIKKDIKSSKKEKENN